jgi:hypothetical protein
LVTLAHACVEGERLATGKALGGQGVSVHRVRDTARPTDGDVGGRAASCTARRGAEAAGGACVDQQRGGLAVEVVEAAGPMGRGRGAYGEAELGGESERVERRGVGEEGGWA